jgi:hypothetical protein
VKADNVNAQAKPAKYRFICTPLEKVLIIAPNNVFEIQESSHFISRPIPMSKDFRLRD